MTETLADLAERRLTEAHDEWRAADERLATARDRLDATLADLADAGVPHSRLARDLGWSKQRVAQRIHRARLRRAGR